MPVIVEPACKNLHNKDMDKPCGLKTLKVDDEAYFSFLSFFSPRTTRQMNASSFVLRH